MGARMRRYQLLAEVDLHQRVAGMQLELLTDVLVRDRIVMLLVLYVIVDVDLDRLDVNVAIRLPR